MKALLQKWVLLLGIAMMAFSLSTATQAACEWHNGHKVCWHHGERHCYWVKSYWHHGYYHKGHQVCRYYR